MENKLTEFEAKMIHIVMYNKYGHGSNFNTEEFIADLRKIMLPTCTLNERKFLDEVKEKAKLISANVYVIYRTLHTIGSVIFAKDFEANLSELVEGKQ
jgi:hypothetical protein